jgi:hypothetical protein
MKQTLFSFFRGSILCSVLVPACLATVIGPGGSTPVSGTTAAARPELAGLVLQDTIVNWTDSLSTTFGTLQTRVVKESSTGTLDFYLRIFNNPQSNNFVSVGRFENYTGFTTDVDYRLDGLGDVGPIEVKRVGSGGSSVNFAFDSGEPDGVAPGQSSLFLLIKTNARNYTTSQGDLVIGPDLPGAPSGDLSNLFTVWAPASSSCVPEPGTYAMIAVGFAVLGMVRRRVKG